MQYPSLNQIDAEIARRHLIDYTQLMFPGYRVSAHHRLIAETLERVERGEIKRLIITVPPRHGKSELVSVRFPAWYLGRHPDRQIILASYSNELASGFGRKNRNQIADPLFRSIFPDCRLAGDSSACDLFSTSRGGVMAAVGVGGAATGRGAHIFVVDDPFKDREEAESKVIRQRRQDWYKDVAYTRLMPGGAVIIMHTRWHDDDLVGYVTREFPNEGWVSLNLPAIAEEGDPLKRAVGEALWPSDYPIEELRRIQTVLGSRSWASLYQQRPVPAAGGMLDMAWFRRYKTPPNGYRRVIQSWDTAQKDDQINDWSVCQTWGEAHNGFYLLNQFRERLIYPDLRRTAGNLFVRDNPHVMLIEDKGSGISLIQDLRIAPEHRYPVKPISVPAGHNKIFRLQGVTGLIESGQVWLPEQAPWLPDFESECRSFPAGLNDDQVDALSQALEFFRTTTYHQNSDNLVDIPTFGVR